MRRLSEVVRDYTIDVAPDRLPSLLPEIDQHLKTLEKSGLHSTAIQLRSLYEEMDDRETRARHNAATSRKAEHAAMDRVAHLEEKIAEMEYRLNSVKLDKDALHFELDLVRQGIRDEIQGAFDDGQAMAITALCIRLGGILNQDADELEQALVQALDGSTDSLYQFLNSLLDGIEQSAA